MRDLRCGSAEEYRGKARNPADMAQRLQDKYEAPHTDRIWVLRRRAMCRMVEAAVAAVSEQSIFVAPLAAAGSALDRGCYRAGPKPYPNSTRPRRSRSGRSR